MNKVFEYMSLGIPFVQFDLDEGVKVAGEAALVAHDNSPVAFAEQMAKLLDDTTLRATLATAGKARAKALLRWETERAQLLAAYDCILKERGASSAVAFPSR